MAEQKLNLSIKVNAETGQLEVMGAKLSDVGNKAKDAGSKFGELGGQTASLVKSYLAMASAGAVAAFFASAIKGAEEENESLRRLKFTLESTGQSWDENKQSIDRWANAVAASTRFSDGEALQAIDKLARSTKTLGQAQAAGTLAMNLSVASGKSLSETTDFVNGLINNQSRAVAQAAKEYGSLTEGATTANGILEALGRKTADAAANEESFTKATSQLKNAWGDFSDQVGNAVAPALTTLITFLSDNVIWAKRVAGGIQGLASIWFQAVTGMGKAWYSAMRFDWDGVKAAAKDAIAGMETALMTSAQNIEKINADQASTFKKVATEKVETNGIKTAEQLAQEEAAAAKAEQMSLELDQKITAIGDETYKKKISQLNAEVAARRAKINREISDEKAKEALLDKLNAYELAQTQQLAKLEVQTKRAVAFETMDTAVQTLAVLNSMTEKGTRSEVIRAKAILALEKAIAIARILSSPQAALNPGLAAAQIALTVAQFAQQMQSIDKAASAFQQGQTSVSVSSPLPGGGRLEETFGGIGGGGSGGGGPNVWTAMGSGGGGGGGSSGTGVIINNSIQINFDVDKLGLDNVDAVMMRITERVRQGVTEGTQLALALKNQADRNGALAI